MPEPLAGVGEIAQRLFRYAHHEKSCMDNMVNTNHERGYAAVRCICGLDELTVQLMEAIRG